MPDTALVDLAEAVRAYFAELAKEAASQGDLSKAEFAESIARRFDEILTPTQQPQERRQIKTS